MEKTVLIKRSLWGLFAAVGLALLLALTISSQVLAQQPTPSDDQVNQVAGQLYCPVCENIPLDVCPTQACAQWRDLIRTKLAAGWTEQQIKDYFSVQYGDRVLAEPPRRGLNWLVYIIPPVGILIGVLILANVLRKARFNSTPVLPSTSVAPVPDDPYLKKMEDALKKQD